MIRSVVGKVMWVGRGTVFMVGLSMILALVLGAASTALAGNLDPLKIGSLKNVATKTTQLVGKVASGSAFVVKNPSGGSALDLQVNAGQAPLKVNAEAGTAANLSADKLDGRDSTAFLQAYSASQDFSLSCSLDENGRCFYEYIFAKCSDVDDYPIAAGRVKNVDTGSVATGINTSHPLSLRFSVQPDPDGDDVTVEFLCFDADGDGAAL